MQYKLPNQVISGILIEEAKAILERWCGYFELGQKKILAFTLDLAKFEKYKNL